MSGFRGLVGIVVVILTVGFGGSIWISEALRSEARSVWEDQAANVARSLSGTLLGWLEESYAPLSGLAALSENSNSLTESEFLNAFDGLEARATAFFLEAAALVEIDPEGGVSSSFIRYTSDPGGVLDYDQYLADNPALLDAAEVAEERFGEVILGHPLEGGNAASRASPVALGTFNTDGDVLIIGVIDYMALVDGLFDLHVPDGVAMRVSGRYPMVSGQGPEVAILDRGTSGVLHTVPIRTVSAGAELLIQWDFDARFAGGVNTGLARSTLVFGIGMTLFAAFLVAFLLSRNRTIQRRVDEATEELSEALDTISASIDYASNMQRAILPATSAIDDVLAEHFVLWEPQSVIGGDVYWLRPWGTGTLLLLGDCTGHGVPGAFMTMIATGALDRARSETPVGEVGSLMQRMHQIIQATQKHGAQNEQAQDGMELGICYFDGSEDSFEFCGARFSIFVASEAGVQEIKGGRKGIGYARVPAEQVYDTVRIPAAPGYAYYLTTDGFVDQVGGTDRRTFGKRRFAEALEGISGLAFSEQVSILQDTLTEYQGQEARLDDVAIIGFRL